MVHWITFLYIFFPFRYDGEKVERKGRGKQVTCHEREDLGEKILKGLTGT